MNTPISLHNAITEGGYARIMNQDVLEREIAPPGCELAHFDKSYTFPSMAATRADAVSVVSVQGCVQGCVQGYACASVVSRTQHIEAKRSPRSASEATLGIDLHAR